MIFLKLRTALTLRTGPRCETCTVAYSIHEASRLPRRPTPRHARFGLRAGLERRLEQAVLLAGGQDARGLLRVDHGAGGPSAALLPVGRDGGNDALLVVRGAARLAAGGRAAHVALALVDLQPGRRARHALHHALARRRCAPSLPLCALAFPVARFTRGGSVSPLQNQPLHNNYIIIPITQFIINLFGYRRVVN